MHRLHLLLISLIFLTACAPLAVPETPPALAPTTPPAPASMTTVLPYPIGTASTWPPLAQAAREALAQTLGLAPEAIELVTYESREWPDSCLGIARPEMACLQVITSGYLIVLIANEQKYEYRAAEGGSPMLVENQTAVAAPVVEYLAKRLGLKPEAITIVSDSPVTWNDSCLGVAHPNRPCAEALTPGALVVLMAEGRTYEYHTNAEASVILPATLAVHWQRTGGIAGFCDELWIYLAGELELTQGCNPVQNALGNDLADSERQALWAMWAQWSTFDYLQSDGPNVSDSMSIALSFVGGGPTAPDTKTQQALALWAQEVFYRATSK